ncbi:MAG: hypothetical protein RLZZ618_1344 [Pseudomonadota bacterium]|jgi:hypothetical protein
MSIKHMLVLVLQCSVAYRLCHVTPQRDTADEYIDTQLLPDVEAPSLS